MSQSAAMLTLTRVKVLPPILTFLAGNASVSDRVLGSVCSELSTEVVTGGVVAGSVIVGVEVGLAATAGMVGLRVSRAR